MRYAGALYIVGWLIFFLAGTMLLPAMFAIYFEDPTGTFAFLALSGLTAFVGGGLILTLRGATQSTTTRENIFLIALAWIVLPIFAALPFLATQSTTSFVAAYFEAVSGLTTTGASVLGPVDQLPNAVLLWRSLLQWLGGLGAIVMTISILAGLGRGRDDDHGPLPGSNRFASATDTFAYTAQTVTAIYGTATILGLFGVWMSGVSFFESTCLSLSAISTGGFSCSEGGTQNLHSPGAELILALLMMYGSINFLLHWAVLRGRLSTYVRDPEPSFFFLFALVLASYIFLATGGNGNPDDAVTEFGFAAFNAVSLLSTTGFWVGDQEILSNLPVVVFVLVTFVGGCSVSSAGGVRIMRVILLVRQSLGELSRLAHPHGVVGVHYGRWAISDQMMFGIWAVFVSFLAALAVLSIVLAGSGIALQTAIVGAISVLSNIGPLFTLITDDPSAYARFGDGTLLVLCIGMIVGRLEVMVILSLFSLAYWRD